MKQQMTISEACAYKTANPTCQVVFIGDIAEVFTGEDITEDMRRPRLISVQQFRDRFTPEETFRYLEKVKTDVNVELLNFKLSTAEEPLDLDSVTLQQGMLYLVFVGVITESRRIEILA